MDLIYQKSTLKSKESLLEFIKELNPLNYYGAGDENNFLRSFSEILYRKSWNKDFYDILCTSFEESYKSNTTYQKAQHITTLGLLDSISSEPVEAKSCMPSLTAQGLQTRNFGYDMQQSISYKQWLKQPLPRLFGDIIIDAFGISSTIW